MIRRAIREYRKAVPKLRRLTPGEWRDMLSAQLALLIAQLRVWTLAQGRLTTPSGDPAPPVSPSVAEIPKARNLALAVSRAATFGVFRPACLVRSVALCRLMERRGIHHGIVRVGVVMRGGRFHAHAWVEYAGEVLGDDPLSVSDYETLPGVNVLHAD